MNNVKIKVIDSDKLINAINEGSYDINLSAVMTLGAVMLDAKKQENCEYCLENCGGCAKTVEAMYNACSNWGDDGVCKKGKWIKNDNGTYTCSVCHSWIPEEQYYYARYCLYCGAKMKGEQDETN